MRRQLKLQGQLAGAHVKRDNDETSEDVSRSLKQQSESSDNEHWEKRQDGGNYPWTKAPCAALSLRMQPVTQKSGKWERPEGPSSEELRSCSIAKLRAKAREHVAEIHGTVTMSGGDTQSQTQEADAMHSDWSFSFLPVGTDNHNWKKPLYCIQSLYKNIYFLSLSGTRSFSILSFSH